MENKHRFIHYVVVYVIGLLRFLIHFLLLFEKSNYNMIKTIRHYDTGITIIIILSYLLCFFIYYII